MKHYVYKLTDRETGEYYFGSRSHEDPNTDSYMGSMQAWKPEDKSRLIKEIIKDDFVTRDDAVEFESLIIEKNIDDNLNENYNIPNKGFHTKGLERTKEWNTKISKGITSYFKELKKNNPEKYSYFCEKMRKLSMGENNGFYGKTHSEETKQKIRDSHPYSITGKSYNEFYGKETAKKIKNKISRSKDKYKKPIIQLNLDGAFIREWDSQKEARRETEISHIHDVIKGRRKRAGGYKWKYKT